MIDLQIPVASRSDSSIRFSHERVLSAGLWKRPSPFRLGFPRWECSLRFHIAPQSCARHGTCIPDRHGLGGETALGLPGSPPVFGSIRNTGGRMKFNSCSSARDTITGRRMPPGLVITFSLLPQRHLSVGFGSTFCCRTAP